MIKFHNNFFLELIENDSVLISNNMMEKGVNYIRALERYNFRAVILFYFLKFVDKPGEGGCKMSMILHKLIK